MELVEEHRAFDGRQRRYRHPSKACNCTMHFSVFLPPAAAFSRVPVIYWLSGLTCTDENFFNKAGAQRIAAELGLALVAPDTSPRGKDVADDGAYDLGQGAGFYVNATQEPWCRHYRMYDYVIDELPGLIQAGLPVDAGRQGVSGHSMGGHGALVACLKNPGRYRSVSAFAPICAPSQCPWGEKAFSAYLGADQKAWRDYDAVALIESHPDPAGIPALLVEQGEADEFLSQQLKPELLEQACARRNVALELRRRSGYDHSYFFIASFMESHLHHHARALSA